MRTQEAAVLWVRSIGESLWQTPFFAFLLLCDYRVLRIEAELVMRDLPAAVASIERAVEELRR
jgi:hypothetical protein